MWTCCIGVLISPYPDQEGNKLGSMSGTRAISTTSRRELSSSFFFLQGKEPKEIHAILTETLACFLPGRAKDLSAHLYNRLLLQLLIFNMWHMNISHCTLQLHICNRRRVSSWLSKQTINFWKQTMPESFSIMSQYVCVCVKCKSSLIL